MSTSEGVEFETQDNGTVKYVFPIEVEKCSKRVLRWIGRVDVVCGNRKGDCLWPESSMEKENQMLKVFRQWPAAGGGRGLKEARAERSGEHYSRVGIVE